MWDDAKNIAALSLPWHHFAGKTILVTGAGGMLPSCAVHTLLALNDNAGLGVHVTCLVRDAGRRRPTLDTVIGRDDVTIIEGDVCDPLAVDDVDDVDLIIHGASPARPALHASAPVATLKANVLGSINLLELCVHHNAGFALMSSSEVYGHSPDDTTAIAEDDYGPLDPLDKRACYPEGKRAAESLAANYHGQYGVPVTIARFGHIYGPGLAADDGRVQADFAANVARHDNIVLLSDGLARRTYTYVADAVSGMFTAILLGSDVAYNVADPSGNITIRQLAKTFVDARPELGLALEFSNQQDGTRLFSAAAHLGLDASKLLALGWQPQVSIAAGVDRTLQSMGC